MKKVVTYLFIKPASFLLAPFLMASVSLKFFFNFGGMLAFAKVGFWHYFAIRRAVNSLKETTLLTGSKAKDNFNSIIAAGAKAEEVARCLLEAELKNESKEQREKKDAELLAKAGVNAPAVKSGLSTLYNTGAYTILRISENPAEMPFAYIEKEYISNEDCLFLFNKELFYVNRFLKTVTKINRTSENQSDYDKLCSILDNIYRREQANSEQILLINSLIGLSHARLDLLTPANRQFLLDAGSNAEIAARGLVFLIKEVPALVTDENRKFLLAAGDNAFLAAQGLVKLYQENPALITPDNRKLMLAAGSLHQRDIYYIASGIAALHQENPTLLTAENCKFLLDSAKKSDGDGGPSSIAEGLVILHQENPALLTAENREFLLGGHPVCLAKWLVAFHRRNSSLITMENRKALIDCGIFVAGKVINALIFLAKEKNEKLVTQETFDALLKAGENAQAVAFGLALLHQHNPELITPKNCEALVNSKANLLQIAFGLAGLLEKDPVEITSENLRTLVEIKHPRVYWSGQVDRGLRCLQQGRQNLITQENLQSLASLAETVSSDNRIISVVDGLDLLKAESIDLINQENFQALLDAGENAEAVALGLALLHQYNPALITPENRKALVDSKANLLQIAYGLTGLLEKSPTEINPENLKVLANADILPDDLCKDSIFYGIRALQQARRNLLTQENCLALVRAGVEAGQVARKIIKESLQQKPKLEVKAAAQAPESGHARGAPLTKLRDAARDAVFSQDSANSASTHGASVPRR